MPDLSQGADTIDERSREGYVEVALEWMTLFTQPPTPDIPDLIQGDDNSTAYIM